MSVTAAAPRRRAEVPRVSRVPVTAVVRQAVFLVICILGLSLFVKSFVGQLFEVPSASMEPTLLIGDTIVVRRALTQWSPPQRGDIVVFRDPGGWLPEHPKSPSAARTVLEFLGLVPYHSGEHLVKRVVGEAGDVIECRGPGPVYVNGVASKEPYVAPGAMPCREMFKVTVPARSIWVLGDNRDDSADSRYHLDRRTGSVPLSSVVGTVVVKAWPPSHWGVPVGGGS
jgi:signal peptidase I